jgi:LacI family transcriptional regulator
VTLSDVARAAGVSLATASRALNGSARTVRPELAESVHAAAARLGYVVDARAQEMARGLSATVAVVLGDIADPYFAGIASGVIAAAGEQGLMVTMAATGPTGRGEREIVAALRSQRPRAIILANSRPRHGRDDDGVADELDAFRAGGGRAAVIADSEGLEPGTLTVHNARGAAQLATSLVELGYRSFAVLAGSDDLDTPQRRASGFTRGLAELGLPASQNALIHGDFSRAGGYRSMTELLATGSRPDCVFAVTDMMAVGAMAAIAAQGLRPGIDIGVAGFDDIEMLQDVSPPLSTVRLPLHRMGRLALDAALHDDGPGAEISTDVVLRDSTPRR